MSPTLALVFLSLLCIGTTSGQESPELQQKLVLTTSASYDKSFQDLRAGLKAGTDFATYVREIMQQANDVLRKMKLHIRLVDSIAYIGLKKSSYSSYDEIWNDISEASEKSSGFFRVILSAHPYFTENNLPAIVTKKQKDDICSATLTVVNVRRPKASGEDVDQMLADDVVVHHVVRGMIAGLGVDEKDSECSCEASCALDQDPNSDSLTVPVCADSLSRLYNFTCLTMEWNSHNSKVPICGNGIVDNMTSTSGYPSESCDCAASEEDCECNLKVCKFCSEVACERGGGMNVLTILALVLAIIVVIGVAGYGLFVILKKKGMIPTPAAQAAAPTPVLSSTDKSTPSKV